MGSKNWLEPAIWSDAGMRANWVHPDSRGDAGYIRALRRELAAVRAAQTARTMTAARTTKPAAHISVASDRAVVEPRLESVPPSQWTPWQQERVKRACSGLLRSSFSPGAKVY